MSDELFQAFESYPYHALKADDQLPDESQPLESWEQQVLTTHLAACQSLLLVAAGGGHELVPLSRAKKHVEAIDFDTQLVDATNRRLRRENLDVRVASLPRYEIPFAECRYDAIWVCRKFLSHIRGRSRRIEFLKRLRERCGPQAVLVLSFYIRHSSGLDWRINQWLGNTVRLLGGKNRTRIELGDHLDLEWPLYHHHFLECDLRHELQQAGFEMTQFTADWFGYAVAVPQTQPQSEPSTALLAQQA